MAYEPDYDAVVSGMKVNVVDGADSLGSKIDALTAAIINLQASVDALAAIMAP